jgi:phenylacetate-CoA ligase
MRLLPLNPVSTIYFMMRHPHVGREQLVAFQNERLRRLVDHAYRNVPYYQRLFDRHKVKPHHIRTVDDLGAVPLTSRTDLQDVPVSEFVDRRVDPCGLITRSSSGSSGRPIVVRRTWLEARLQGAFRLRALASLGLRARDKHCYIMELPDYQRQDRQTVQRILATFGIARKMIVNGVTSPAEIVRALHQFGPAVVSGYPGVLARIAQTVGSDELRSLRLRFVSTGGEVLTPLMRRQIQDGFAVPVYDTYGASEFNLLAWECRARGEYHSCDDAVIVEVLRDALPVAEGERGEVVGTDLHSFAMPLIRYRLGDVVTKGSEMCPCGQPFSTIRAIEGRMVDYFTLPGGRVLHPYALGVHKTAWIREFQVTQESLVSIVVRVVPFHSPSTREMAALVQPVISLIGPNVRLRVDLVPDIPLDAGGKFRVYRSRIRSGDDGLARPDGTEKSPPLE